MPRVLVIGGRGHFGARVLETVRALELPGLEVTAASRRAAYRVDLADPESFPVMLSFDVIVNCADTVRAPPDAAARYCLERGLIFMDMGADAVTVERLLALRLPQEQTSSSPARGVVIVGVGVFPGLSTALAAQACALAERPEGVTLGVRLSPLSGAGPGNCALMVHMLQLPSVRFEGGRRVEGSAVGAALTLPYAGVGPRVSNLVGLPDAALIHRATGALAVQTAMALNPGVFRFSFRAIAWMLAIAGPLRGLLLALTRWSLFLLRGVLLRRVESRVQLTASARAREQGEGEEVTLMLDVADGREGAALGVAAVVSCCLERQLIEPGVYAVPELFELDALIAATRGLGTSPLTVTRAGQSARGIAAT